jgi:hypothetical protein
MSTADASSEAAAVLARARWGDTKVRRAVRTVVERQDELAPDLLAELRAVTGAPVGGDDG